MRAYVIILFFLVLLVVIIGYLGLLLIASPTKVSGDPAIEIKGIVQLTKTNMGMARDGATVTFTPGKRYSTSDFRTAATPGDMKFCIENSQACPKEYMLSTEKFYYNAENDSIEVKQKVKGTLWAYRPEQYKVEIWVGLKETG
ncbi:hypothetical protein K8R43_02145 [archaeon]|nr:hypothetical protein [archaeon]